MKQQRPLKSSLSKPREIPSTAKVIEKLEGAVRLVKEVVKRNKEALVALNNYKIDVTPQPSLETFSDD